MDRGVCRVVVAATTAVWLATGSAAYTPKEPEVYYPPKDYKCVDAYSKAVSGYDDHAYCFQKHPLSLSHWGWTHKICRGSEQKHVLWAHADGCDTSHAHAVGYAHIAYDDTYGKLYVKVGGKDGCDVAKLHVYVGSDYLPKHDDAYQVTPYDFEYGYHGHKVYEFEVATEKYGAYVDCLYIVVYAEACCPKPEPPPYHPPPTKKPVYHPPPTKKPVYPPPPYHPPPTKKPVYYPPPTKKPVYHPPKKDYRPIAPPAPRTDCYKAPPCDKGQCRVPGSCACSYRVKCPVNPCSQYSCEYGHTCIPDTCGECTAYCVEKRDTVPRPHRPVAPPAPAPCGPYSPPCDRGQCRVPDSCECSYRVKCPVNPCSQYSCEYGYKCVPNACSKCTAWCVPDKKHPVY